MMLLILLFGGGWLYWTGWIAGQRVALLAGAGALGGALVLVVVQGGIAPVAFPILALAAGLAASLKWVHQPVWQAVGWVLYVLVVLALGFRLLPGFAPVPVFEASGAGNPPVVGFSPEKLILLGLVPLLIMTPVAPPSGWFGRDRPRLTFALILVITVMVLVFLALALGFARPGWALGSLPVLAYQLADNLVFACVLEESFFRGIVQTALIRGFADRGWSQAAPLGIIVASLLFGGVHMGGGGAFMLLATVAGLGYGVAYYLTGRIHDAVAVHFAVNAVHILCLAAPPVAR
ncbi:MAG: CPBP family intramembrane glutamic endopeptidase [Candidatus Contendobacter sp.]